MSRVIKGLSVKLQSPLIVQHTNDTGSETPPPDDSGGLISEQDVGQLKDQAAQILTETEQMVKELLETARLEAEKIIRNAREEALAIIEEGRENLRKIEEEAYSKGWQEGDEAARKKYEEKLKSADDILEKAHEKKWQVVAGSEEDIVRLAVAVARKVINREIETSPEIVIDMVKLAIRKATDREELTVRVNPDNLDVTINAKDNISQEMKGIRKLKVLADPDIARGGCVVESNNGTVDARIERQMNEIEQALMEVNPNAEV
ncbi:FliH/SctL family protein [Phosphitispora sp. TUW77]|uniref:FliH/SctL family protein n=1 Tax=Phosphitispora sp. TUW77 TaxID=3152361 RepID=UPI003AB4D4DB